MSSAHSEGPSIPIARDSYNVIGMTITSDGRAQQTISSATWTSDPELSEPDGPSNVAEATSAVCLSTLVSVREICVLSMMVSVGRS